MLSVLAPLMIESTARANTCIVTSLADSGPGTLRDAIVAQTCDVISCNVRGQIGLTSGELSIKRSLTITGPGASLLTVTVLPYPSADINTFGIFRVNVGQTVVISGLNLSNVRCFCEAAAIANRGTLTINNVTIAKNLNRGG